MLVGTQKLSEFTDSVSIYVGTALFDGLVDTASKLANLKNNGQLKPIHRLVPQLIEAIIIIFKFPFTIWYVCWVTAPLWLFSMLAHGMWGVVESASLRNQNVKDLLGCSERIYQRYQAIHSKVVNSQFARLIIFCIQTAFEVGN